MLRIFLRLLAVFGLAACTPEPPVKIGFISGLSGSVGELGSAGRNGALLAVELKNAAGGVRGRRIELLMRDDGNSPEIARAALRELAGLGVVAVAGPMTSTVGKALAPLAGELDIVLMGGTVATSDLSGRDDHFFRVVGASNTYATRSAQFARQRAGARTAMVFYDAANGQYTERWSEDFRLAFEQAGGRVVNTKRFDSREPTDFGELASQAHTLRPDMVVLAASARDAGLIGRRIRQALPEVKLLGVAWSASLHLIEMGGDSINGMVVEQYYDMVSVVPGWLSIRSAYHERFGIDADYAAMAGYEAASVLILAIERGASRSSMKSTLLKSGEFAGLQSTIRFDPFGDADRPLFFGRVADRQFESVRP